MLQIAIQHKRLKKKGKKRCLFALQMWLYRSLACSPPPPPAPSPVYYPMPAPALPPAHATACPGSCPSTCAPVCSVKCCIGRNAALNSIRPLSYSQTRMPPATYRYRNYYPASQSNNYYTQYKQYAQARSQYPNPYQRYQAYRTSYGNWKNIDAYRG